MTGLGIGNREILATIKGLPLLDARVKALEEKIATLEAKGAKKEAKKSTKSR